MASDPHRIHGIEGDPCVPLFLLDPEQLRSPKKPVPKIARPKPPTFFDGLREKEREMVARRLLLKHVYGTNFGRDSCDKLQVLLEKQQEINSTKPAIPDAPNHSTYIQYPLNAYQRRKQYQYTQLLKSKDVFDPKRDKVRARLQTQPKGRCRTSQSRRDRPASFSPLIARLPSRAPSRNLRPRSKNPRPLTRSVEGGTISALRKIGLVVPEDNKHMPWFSNTDPDRPGALQATVRPGFNRMQPTPDSFETYSNPVEQIVRQQRRAKAATRPVGRGRKRGLPWSVLKKLHEV